MAIVLYSDIYEVVTKGKTRAKLFKDMKTGDRIRFSMVIQNQTGSSGGGNYATDIEIENLTQGTSGDKSQSVLSNLLNNGVVLKKVTEDNGNIGTVWRVSRDKSEFAPTFYPILGERVRITGEPIGGKYPVWFIDKPELINVAQRIRGDLLIETEAV